MSWNDYGNLIEEWKVNLIEMRARAMGFSEDDIPDLQQEIILHLLEFEYDETRGASESTALHRIIDRKLINARRDRTRQVRRLNNETVSLDEADAAERPRPGMSDTKRCALRLDLEAAIAGLEGLAKAVCKGLLRGDSKAEIAAAYGRTDGAVSHAIHRVRRRFSARGLHSYLG
jgi:DNA-directed RNA polymerase specialized sigma24 family protein